MKMKLLQSVAVAAAAVSTPFVSATAEDAAYAPAQWNLEAREKFASMRFGIFIHWGLYANYAQGEWYLQSARLDEKAYSRMMYGFCPSKFNAREWAEIVKSSGAKYITITSRHHDGFSLWPSKADDGYNIGNTPFKRDILGELAQACSETGLQLNFYYSLMDWHRTDYPAGRRAKVVLGNQKGDYKSYKKFMLAQIGELIERYHPGSIWFDGEWDHAWHDKDGKEHVSLDWQMDDINDFIHARRTLVGNNHHGKVRAKEDFQVYECDTPGDTDNVTFSAHQKVVKDRPVEQCDLIQLGAWGYRISASRYRSAQEVVAMAAIAASRNSNLLINVGPDGSGQFPEKTVRILRQTGEWFAKNGESIYGTSGCPVAKGKDIVSTRRGGTLYLHFLKPGRNEISFKVDGTIRSAVYLETGKPADVSRNADGTATVKISRPAGNSWDVVVKLTVE